MSCELCMLPFDDEDGPSATNPPRLPLIFVCCGHSPCLVCTSTWHSKQRAMSKDHGSTDVTTVNLTCPSCDTPFVSDPKIHTYHGYILNRGMLPLLKRSPGSSIRAQSADKSSLLLSSSLHSSSLREPISAARPAGPLSLRACTLCHTAPATTVCVVCAQNARPALCCAEHSTCTCDQRYPLAQQVALTTNLIHHCTDATKQLDNQDSELQGELDSLPARAAELRTLLEAECASVVAGVTRLRELIPRHLDYAAEERAKQISLAQHHLHTLKSLYLRIQTPLTVGAVAHDPVHTSLTLARAQQMFVALRGTATLAALSSAVPPSLLANESAEGDGVEAVRPFARAENLLAAMRAHFSQEDGLFSTRTGAWLSDTVSRVPDTDPRMDHLLGEFARAEFGPTLSPVMPSTAMLSDSVPTVPSPEISLAPEPQLESRLPDYTDTANGITTTDNGSSELPPKLGHMRKIVHSVNIPPVYTLVSSPTVDNSDSAVDSEVTLVSYDEECGSIFLDPVGGAPRARAAGIFVGTPAEGQLVSTIVPGTSPECTVIMARPHILLHQGDKVSCSSGPPVVNYPKDDRRYAQIIDSPLYGGTIIGMGSDKASINASIGSLIVVESVDRTWSRVPYTCDFDSKLRVLVNYENYLLIFYLTWYVVCGRVVVSDEDQAIQITSPITDGHNLGILVRMCRLDTVHHRGYFLTLGDQVSVFNFTADDRGVHFTPNESATTELNKYIQGPVRNIHWVAARSTSFFYVLKGNSSELHEVCDVVGSGTVVALTDERVDRQISAALEPTNPVSVEVNSDLNVGSPAAAAAAPVLASSVETAPFSGIDSVAPPVMSPVVVPVTPPVSPLDCDSYWEWPETL